MADTGIPVGVIEDHPLYRTALAGLLDDEPGIELDAVAESVTRFAARRQRHDSVVLLGQNLPGLQDAAAVMELVRLGHKVLGISAQAARAQVLGAMDAGARGYLCKDADATEIIRAIREIAAGRRHVSPTVASFVLAASASRARYPELSMREIEVLAKVAAGERDQDIADALQISVRTVRSYLDRIRDKTGLRRRTELTRYAIGRGYVDHGSSSDQLLPA
jgi:DNA-binding NarL/FixJ family response regulator